jgi:hypothetical protein
MTAGTWTPADDLAALAKQLHDERCISWGCPGTPHTLDWIMARRILKAKVTGSGT